jgi:hypothetical protein
MLSTVTLSAERLYCFNGLRQRAVKRTIDLASFYLIRRTYTFLCQNVVTPVAGTEQSMKILQLKLDVCRKEKRVPVSDTYKNLGKGT